MIITSPEFVDMQTIPERYTCKGENISVPLKFGQTPKGTVTYAIIVDDPDAPGGIFTHWVAWNIPADSPQIIAGMAAPKEGTNSFNVIGYKGPCPPPGKPHRYIFKVYALDTILNLPQGSKKEALEAAMRGHILDQAQLIGTFKR